MNVEAVGLLMSQDCAFSDVTDSTLELCGTGMHEPSGVTTIEGVGIGGQLSGEGRECIYETGMGEAQSREGGELTAFWAYM